METWVLRNDTEIKEEKDFPSVNPVDDDDLFTNLVLRNNEEIVLYFRRKWSLPEGYWLSGEYLIDEDNEVFHIQQKTVALSEMKLGNK